MMAARREQRIDSDPSARVQIQADPLGFVPQDEAQKFARSSS